MRNVAARGGSAAAALFVLCAFHAPTARSVPLSVEELGKVCAEAEDASHCGRLVEAVQLPRLPSLAVRDGLDLRVSLYPSGTATFTDVEALTGGRSYSLWDFISEINAVVLYVNEGDDARFTLLQRTTGRRTELPSDPKLSPDRARIVTADFCERRCTNELAVWRVSRDGLRKELVWRPDSPWADAAATWRDSETLSIDYMAAGATSRSRLLRRMAEADWVRPPAP
jgi:hypothetical protein